MVRVFDASLTDATPGNAPAYGYALAEAPDGRTYAICSEGVGWEVTEDRPLIVDTFAGGYALSLSEVTDRAERGTDVDLADFVRTFGARLESNFFQWSYRLSGK
jgi:hypothetical protein